MGLLGSSRRWASAECQCVYQSAPQRVSHALRGLVRQLRDDVRLRAQGQADLRVPRISITTRAGTRRCNSSVAAACRASCSRASRTPAALSRAFQSSQSRRTSMGRPFSSGRRRSRGRPMCSLLPAVVPFAARGEPEVRRRRGLEAEQVGRRGAGAKGARRSIGGSSDVAVMTPRRCSRVARVGCSTAA